MHKLSTILIIFCVMIVGLSFQDSTKYQINAYPNFLDGEELQYELHYGFIVGGHGYITLKQENLKGEDVLHAVARAQTANLADKFFHVVDIYESYFEPLSNLPVKTVRNIHEGNYKEYNEVYFNHQNNTITSNKGDRAVPKNILDMVSAFFYLRRMDFSHLKEGDIIWINTYFGDEIYPFYIVYKGREVVSTSLAEIKCFKFVPVVEPGRIFKNKDDILFG